jgi:hypothetical protein
VRAQWLASVAGVALVLLPVLVLAEDAAKPITVELKKFTFKVPEGKEDLFGYNEGDEKLFFYTNGTANAKIKVAEDGDYEIVIKASGDAAMNEGAKFKLAVDGKQIGKETETATGDPKEHKFPTTLKAGEHKLSIEFTNDVYKENEYDRNLYVHGVMLKRTK